MSDNVKRLMAHYVDLGTIDKLSKRSGVPRGTVHRIKMGSLNCRIDNLDAIAQAFELSAWHLMIPGLDPTNPPVYLSEREKALYSRMAETARELHPATTGSFAPLHPKKK